MEKFSSNATRPLLSWMKWILKSLSLSFLFNDTATGGSILSSSFIYFEIDKGIFPVRI